MLFKRLLPSFAFLLLLAAPAVYAQQTTLTCTTGQVCTDSNGDLILGASSIVTQQPDTTPTVAPNSIVGDGNVLTDTNTTPNSVLTDTIINGNQNAVSASASDNMVNGSYNTFSGAGGNLQINGFHNNVQSNDGNININGTGNTVTGSTGSNWGLTVNGGSNTITASTGTYDGPANTVTNATNSSIQGQSNTLTDAYLSSIDGSYNVVTAPQAFVGGDGNNVPVTATGSVTVGETNTNSAPDSTVLGQSNSAGPNATNAVLIGTNNTGNKQGNIAIGVSNTLNCTDCGTIGSGITNNQNLTEEFAGWRLTNIAYGLDPNDAAAVGQITPFATYLGGGSSFNSTTGQFTAPTYTFGTNSFNNVGSALSFLYGLDGSGGGTPGPVGPTGPTGPQGPSGTNGTNGNVSDPLAVHYDSSTDSSVTLQGANGTTISNVAPGAVNATSMQAVNGSQLYNAEQAANNYTDQQVQKAENWAQAYTNQQVSGLNTRINDSEAMSAAMTNMTASFAGQNPNNHNRISAGVGFAGGSNAIAVGYQHVNEAGNFAWNVGGSAGGRDREIGAGAGFSW